MPFFLCISIAHKVQKNIS